MREDLAEIKTAFEALLEITTEGILIHDHGVIVDYNPALAKMSQYGLGELRDKNVIEALVTPEYQNLVLEKMHRNFKQPYEIISQRKDGSVFPVVIIAAREIRYKNQALRIAAVRDLTEKKKTGKALQKSETFLSTIIENIPDMIFLKDAHDLRYVLFNKAGENLLGYQREALIGKTDFDIFPEHEAAFFRQKDKAVLESGRLVVIPEEPIQTRKNGVRILSTKKIPILNKEGKPWYVLGIARDMTVRKKAEKEKRNLEQQLHQAQKMESLGTLAGGIAHDFNNILSSILGYTDLSLSNVGKGTPLERNLQKVYTAGIRARDLVKQILSFARRVEVELKPIKVSEIAKDVLKLLRPTIPASIEIRQNIESDSLIRGDATQIHQIFMNLGTNAAHAMDERGGFLDVTTSDTQIDQRGSKGPVSLKPGEYLKIAIADTGVGIAPEVIDHIFEPYFTTKNPGEGTGMGLATVHGIVKGYGGDIEVESQMGKGTVFTIYLPVTEKRDISLERTSEVIPSGNERVLFVDDELSLVELNKQILEHLGYKVTVRTSSVEALVLFKQKPNGFDLVITDMTMPKMTGDDLARAIKKIQPDIPIILCTGFSSEITPENSVKMGVSSILMKPVTIQDLAKTVRKVLDDSLSCS